MMTNNFDKLYNKLLKKYKKTELDSGIDIESEHTDDPVTKLEIASDHLKEFPNYYENLKQMEKRLKKEKKTV